MWLVAAGVAMSLASAGVFAQNERSDVAAMRAVGMLHRMAPHLTPEITAEQRAMLDEKLVIAARLMENAVGSEEISADHRMWLMETIYRTPVKVLRDIGLPAGREATLRAIAGAAKPAGKLGAASTELVYYPITPCRYIDTRNVGGPITQPRGFDLGLAGNTHGGSAACNPKTAVGGNEDTIGAIAMNVTILGPTQAPGFIGVRPAGDTATTSLVNWYFAGPTIQAANAAVVSINQTPATVNEFEFFGNSTQVIVDIFGVFAAPTATALDCTNGTETNVTANTAARNFNLAATACPAGYSMVSNSCQASGDTMAGVLTLAGQGTFIGGSNCFGHYAGATSANITNTPLCCRLPGR